MAYLVEFAARAVRDLEILYVEKKAAESQAAARWYNGLEEAVYSVRIGRVHHETQARHIPRRQRRSTGPDLLPRGIVADGGEKRTDADRDR
jgi:hypothetical protein